MRELAIVIEPFELINLLELTIEKQVNEHTRAKLSGYIDEALEDTYVDMAQNNGKIYITVKDIEGNKQVIFIGRANKVEIQQCGNLRKLEIEAVSESYLFDVKKKTRTFQNEAQSYEAVLNTVVQGYKAAINLSVGNGQSMKNVVVQYKETDWHFMKRLASQVNTYLVQDDTKEGYNINFGPISKSNSKHIDQVKYSIVRDISDYLYKFEHQVPNITEADCIGYQIESREIYQLCDQINFKQQQLYVAKITTNYIKNELIHTYLLKRKKGMEVPTYYNEEIVGASLDASVIDVKDDVVKVHILVDESQNKDTAKWFAYSTVYSSPDGTGWYCMPEIGDKMRIYFPNEKEADSFAISAVHLEAINPTRSNPDHKCLSTKYGKCILFKEDELFISNGHGSYIRLHDENGIEIVTDKKIKIDAAEDILLHSEQQIVTSAPDSISFEQGNSKLEIKDDITITGGEVKIQE